MKIIIEPENGPVQVWDTEPAENRATLYENRAKELEKRLAEEKDRAEAWELRCAELGQDLRDAQERIHELDWLIAQYDDENRKLKEANADTAEDVLYYKGEMEQYKADVEELKKRNDRLWLQNRNMATWQSWSEAVEGHRWDSEMLEDYGNGVPPKACLNDWAHRIHEIAVQHGWWETEDGKCDDGDRPFPEIVALCHSELSEALEEYRIGKPMAYINGYWPKYDTGMTTPKPIKVMQLDEWEDDEKPEGIAVEMLDCIIRILDWMGHEGIDVDTLMEKKVKFNEGREHRHGGKKA